MARDEASERRESAGNTSSLSPLLLADLVLLGVVEAELLEEAPSEPRSAATETPMGSSSLSSTMMMVSGRRIGGTLLDADEEDEEDEEELMGAEES